MEALKTIKAYRNLNAPKGTIEWSIKPKHGVCKNKVAMYCNAVAINNAVFKVQPAGADRVKRRQQREVIAWVEGETISIQGARQRLDNDYTFDQCDLDNVRDDAPYWDDCRRVEYWALRGDKTFIFADTGEPITKAEVVVCLADGSCWAWEGE